VALPININDLLGARTVESNRIEFKEGWNPDAIYRSICAFANDFDNGGGGYIIIGVAEEQGRAKRPVKGLSTDEIARIQREMIGYNNQLKPPYHPRLFIEEVDEQLTG
jgi:ATP-dependent DNA helicase RecG